MKGKIISTSIVAIAVAVTGAAFFDQLVLEEEYVSHNNVKLSYVPSDITLANENLVVAPSTASWATTDISKIKQTVLSTFRGTVANIAEPIDWSDNVGVVHGAIPIIIDVTKNTKDLEKIQYREGDSFTFYVDSIKLDQGTYVISSYEPEFEVGEEVIVHIAKSKLGPMGEGGNNYFVELGDFGKYKIKENKAYNEKFPQGKSIEEVLKEAQ